MSETLSSKLAPRMTVDRVRKLIERRAKAKGMSRYALAEAAAKEGKMSPTLVYEFLAGRRDDMYLSRFLVLCRILDIRPASLIDLVGEPVAARSK